MDHESLSDMGMASLGHRLKLLRAVWEVKRDQGIEVGQDEWKPADVDLGQVSKEAKEVDKLIDTIGELRES